MCNRTEDTTTKLWANCSIVLVVSTFCSSNITRIVQIMPFVVKKKKMYENRSDSFLLMIMYFCNSFIKEETSRKRTDRF